MQKILGDDTLINSLTKGYSPLYYKLCFSFILLSLSLIIISAANPIRKLKSGINQSKSIDIIFAVDASNSMLCEDIVPSRLEASKKIINILLSQLGNSRIGIITFGGKPFLQLPVTTDIVSAQLYINSISTDAVPEQGTSIEAALKLSYSALTLPEKRPKAIILISDGEDHGSKTADETDRLSRQGIKVFTIGAGSAKGSEINDNETGKFKKDKGGNVIVSKLNEPLLKEIAHRTNGKYFFLDDLQHNSKPLIAELSNLEKDVSTSENQSNYTSLYQIFLFLAVLLLVAEIFIPETKKVISST